jgi:uncharacterized protein (TIGR03435 family)
MIPRLCIACILTCSIASGQTFVSPRAAATPATDPHSARAINAFAGMPRFDAVSIKPATATDQQINAIYPYPDGRIFCAHCTLEFLTSLAFGLGDWQITGTADWNLLAGNPRYDINATAPESYNSAPDQSHKSPLTEQQRQMLKSLLIDRFQLQGHSETRSDTVYILERGDQPLRLAPPLHPNESHWAGGVHGGSIGADTGIAGRNISMPEFGNHISAVLKRPVIDHTGLTGSFDFECRATDPAPSDVASALAASMHALGLKLTPAKGPVEVLVIDHIDRPHDN